MDRQIERVTLADQKRQTDRESERQPIKDKQIDRKRLKKIDRIR